MIGKWINTNKKFMYCLCIQRNQDMQIFGMQSILYYTHNY